MSGVRRRAAAGRREVARRPPRSRVDLTAVLAVLVPLVALVVLAFVRPGTPPAQEERPPTRSELTRATLVCPSSKARLSIATASGESGEVTARVGDGPPEQVAVSPDALTSVTGGNGPATVTALDALAPGLVAGRFPTQGAPTAPECRTPGADEWFTGLGAGARHSSVIELVNPDAGPAVVDIAVQGRRGAVDAPSLRGVSVPARAVVRIDLAKEVPRRGDLAAHVTTSRGRVTASVRDRVDQLGAGASGEDWLGAQAEPAESALLLGVARGSGRRQLVLANGTDDEARVRLDVVTDAAVFAPEGVDEIVVPAQGVARVGLARTLTDRALRDGVGLLVESTRPVTSSVRSFVDGDLSLAVPGEALAAGTTSAVVPGGPKSLVVAGAESSGVAVLTALDADGQQVAVKRAEIQPERATSLDLPDKARLLHVRLRGTTASASVILDGEAGAAFVRLRDPETSGLVADVQPARR